MRGSGVQITSAAPLPFFIQQVLAGVSFFKSFKILQGCPGDTGHGFFGEEGLMPGDQHVRKGQKPGEHIVLNDGLGEVFKEHIGFVFVDVQPQPADLVIFQSVNDGARVDQAATAGIDDHDGVFHRTDGLFIDHVSGLRCERAVQTDNVAVPEQRVQIGRDDGVVTRLERKRVVGQNLAAKAGQDVGRHLADATHTDNTGGLVMQVEAHQAIEGEIALPHPCIGLVQFAVERQDHADRMLGHGIGGIGGDVDDIYAELSGRFHIHIVKARTAQGDMFDSGPGQMLYDGAVQCVIDENTDRVRTFDQRQGLVVQMGLYEGQVVVKCAVFLSEIVLVIWFGAKNEDFHEFPFFFKD